MKSIPIWEQLFEISEMRPYEVLIERIADEALAEAKRSASSARRSIGQLLRRDRAVK